MIIDGAVGLKDINLDPMGCSILRYSNTWAGAIADSSDKQITWECNYKYLAYMETAYRWKAMYQYLGDE